MGDCLKFSKTREQFEELKNWKDLINYDLLEKVLQCLICSMLNRTAPKEKQNKTKTKKD